MTPGDERGDGESDTDDGAAAADVDDRRRRLLGYGGLALLAGAGIAGSAYLAGSDDQSGPSTPTERRPETPSETAPPGAPAIVRRFAPDLHFGRLEKWFPTDPRQYREETDDGWVVDGFRALEEYTAAFEATGTPPAPTAFYNLVDVTDDVVAVQYWLYSVFDQFTVNFHWHDWELLQVFVDRDDGTPVLVSASAHSRSVPNNEYAEPALAGSRRPGVLAEVGSHSSATDLNAVTATFQRYTVDGNRADVTNDLVELLESPFAYGLPRDEGGRLPFVLPELDGHALHDHPDLAIGRSAFVDESVTVDSWHGLPRPPADVPEREPGLVMTAPDSATDGDVTYHLESIRGVREAVDDFVGPQLSFEFAVPGFVEDQFASHITSVGIPWTQERFTDPLVDVTDPRHRRSIGGSAPDGLEDRVVGRVRQLLAGTDGALERVSDAGREAAETAASVSLHPLDTDLAVRLASDDPVASVTRTGEFGLLDVSAGDHTLALAGPGVAPCAVGFVHEGGTHRVGDDGHLTVVRNEDAAWIRGDGRSTSGVERVRVVEDYAGVAYDGRPVQTDRFAVAVHREGDYTVEVVDAAGRQGAYRVAFDDDSDRPEDVREAVQTGKASLATALAGSLADLESVAATRAERDDGGWEVVQRLGTTTDDAERAASLASEGDADGANERLASVDATLSRVQEILVSDDRGGYTEASASLLLDQVRDGIRRARVAIDTPVVHSETTPTETQAER